VTDFHWWGSYPAGGQGGVRAFGIFIFADVPEAALPSHPDPANQPWGAGPLFVGTDVSEVFYAEADNDIYQYNYVISDPADWFYQEQGKVYWLVIMAAVTDDNTQWGWHTAAPPFPEGGLDTTVILRNFDFGGDNATYTDWAAIYRGSERVQMAFELSTIPEPGTVALLGSGVLILVGLLRRRRMSV
jgi:hypothetical protein